MSKKKNTDVLDQLVDELGVQAWLARKELTDPSELPPEDRKEISLLAQFRDEMRVQFHLGKLEAADWWKKAESEWKVLKDAVDSSDDAGSKVREVIGRIRERYTDTPEEAPSLED